MIMRGLRVQCHPLCRRTIRYLTPGSSEPEMAAQLERALARW